MMLFSRKGRGELEGELIFITNKVIMRSTLSSYGTSCTFDTDPLREYLI